MESAILPRARGAPSAEPLSGVLAAEAGSGWHFLRLRSSSSLRGRLVCNLIAVRSSKNEQQEGSSLQAERLSFKQNRLAENLGNSSVLKVPHQTSLREQDRREEEEDGDGRREERQEELLEKLADKESATLLLQNGGISNLFVARSPNSRPWYGDVQPWRAGENHDDVGAEGVGLSLSSVQEAPQQMEKEAWRMFLGGRGTEDKNLEGAGGEEAMQTIEPITDRVVYLESVGVDVEKALHAYPKLMYFSKANLMAKVKFLEARGVKGEHVAKILTASPEIFERSVQAELLPIALFLMEEVKVPKRKLGKMLYRHPRLLIRSIQQLSENLEFVRSLGVKDTGKVVYNNPGLLGFHVKERLLPNFQYLQGLGIPERDVCTMLARFPSILLYGLESNVKPKVEYLTKVMQRSVEELVEYPQYLGASLEYKIRPRHQFLCQHQGIKMSLKSMLLPPDDLFYDRYRTGPVEVPAPSMPIQEMHSQEDPIKL